MFTFNCSRGVGSCVVALLLGQREERVLVGALVGASLPPGVAARPLSMVRLQKGFTSKTSGQNIRIEYSRSQADSLERVTHCSLSSSQRLVTEQLRERYVCLSAAALRHTFWGSRAFLFMAWMATGVAPG